jgi:Rrf2 family protein
MILSNTSKYGLRAVIYLAINAKEKEKIGIKKIAGDLDIPMPFLGKILQTLARHKVLSSSKGPHGGFGLGKKPEQIKLLDVIKILEGDHVFDTCLISLKSCVNRNKKNTPCPVHNKFDTVRRDIIKFFEKESIHSIANELAQNKKIEI